MDEILLSYQMCLMVLRQAQNGTHLTSQKYSLCEMVLPGEKKVLHHMSNSLSEQFRCEGGAYPVLP